MLKEELNNILALLMPANRLICEVALQTGLRVGDILKIRTDELKQRMTIREQKTGKSRRIYMSAHLIESIMIQAGPVWAFPGRFPDKPRTRQAVWYDINRAQKALRLRQNVGTHSMRKIYAVGLYKRYGDIKAVQRALNHDNELVTQLYAWADIFVQQRLMQKERRQRKR